MEMNVPGIAKGFFIEGGWGVLESKPMLGKHFPVYFVLLGIEPGASCMLGKMLFSTATSQLLKDSEMLFLGINSIIQSFNP